MRGGVHDRWWRRGLTQYGDRGSRRRGLCLGWQGHWQGWQGRRGGRLIRADGPGAPGA